MSKLYQRYATLWFEKVPVGVPMSNDNCETFLRRMMFNNKLIPPLSSPCILSRSKILATYLSCDDVPHGGNFTPSLKEIYRFYDHPLCGKTLEEVSSIYLDEWNRYPPNMSHYSNHESREAFKTLLESRILIQDFENPFPVTVKSDN